jgi:hypothetical protein
MAPLLEASELVQISLGPRLPVRKPEWLKAKAPGGETFHALKKMARELNLHTVCESAQCPNRRVLEPEGRHLHDARQSLHPALRLLRRPQGKA